MENLFADLKTIEADRIEFFKSHESLDLCLFNARFELYNGTAIDLYDSPRELVLKVFDIFDIENIEHFYYYRVGSLRRKKVYQRGN